MPMEQELISPAAYYATRLGYKIVPCEWGTKRPLLKDWNTRILEPSEVVYQTRRVCNIAVHVGASGLAVIDRDGTAEDTDEWMEAMGLSRKSPMVVETTKGHHEYFRVHEGIKEVRSRIRFHGPVDILMGDRIVIFPPSWYAESEHRYALQAGKRMVRPQDLPVLPEKLVALLNHVEPQVQRQTQCAPVDEARLLKYVEQIDRSTQGSSGSSACIKACLKILTLVQGDVVRAWPLLQHYNRTRCDPPFDEEAKDGPNSLSRKLSETRKFWNPNGGK